MGWFKTRDDARKSVEWAERHAAELEQEAKQHARKAKKFRDELNSGRSQDREADMYGLRQAEAFQQNAERNAREWRKSAKSARKGLLL